MANIGSYTKRNFTPLSQILAYDPSGQVTSLIPGQSLLDYIGLPEFNEALINRVQWFTTNDVAKIEDLPLGRIIYTGGNTTIADGGGGHYVVVETGGSVVLDNGFELLLLPLGDLTGSDATNALTTTSTGSQTVAGALDSRWISSLSTVAQMVAATDLAIGDRVRTSGYTTSGDGGGNDYEIVAGGTGAADGGSFIDLDNGLQAKGLFGVYVNVSQFGAVGDGVEDDSAPIQAAIDYAATEGWVKTNVEIGANFFGAYKRVVFPTKVFLIGSTISIPSNYNQIDFNKSLFLPHASFNLADWAFDIDAYLAEYTGLRLGLFTNGIKIGNPNLDTTVVKFNDLQASNVSNLFEITLRSALFVVEGFRFDDVKIAAKVIDGDKVVFKDGWLSADPFENNDEAHFILDSATSPSLHLDGLFYVPTTQTATKCALVNLGSSLNNSPCRVYINNILAGAEDGRVALVNSFAKGATGRGVYINITDGSSFTASNPVVRLYDLPNAVSFTNQSGGIDETHVLSMVYFDTTIQTFAAAEAAVTPGVYPEIWFNGYRPGFFENLPRATRSTIGKLVRSENKTFRSYMQGVTTSPVDVEFNTTAVRFERGKTWKIKATNLDNPGADRYTEVIVAGNAGGTALSFVTLVQGTVVAPQFVDSAGTLQVKSSSGTNDFAIEIEQVTDATEVFLT